MSKVVPQQIFVDSESSLLLADPSWLETVKWPCTMGCTRRSLSLRCHSGCSHLLTEKLGNVRTWTVLQPRWGAIQLCSPGRPKIRLNALVEIHNCICKNWLAAPSDRIDAPHLPVFEQRAGGI